MEWFYTQVDLTYVNSEFYRQAWIDRGISPDKLEILPRGIQTDLFQPQKRDEKFWEERGAKGTKLLYVGRVSKEKELEFMVKIYKELKRKKLPSTLCIVGDGPYRAEMKKELPDAIFTGILTGHELSVAYASADIFVFPSTTDTFGNVVIEATASGLPVFVSDVGGPKELITMKNQGAVLPAGNLEAWVTALENAVKNPPSRSELIANSKALHSERSWDEAFNQLWTREKKAVSVEKIESQIKEVQKTSKKKTSLKSSGAGQEELFGSAAQD
jgi:glycosyltransferase involved in cell wall biosynthesis